MNYIEKSKKMLNLWIQYSQKDLYTPPERPDLMCYGAGYNGWGMQTHQKAFAAFVVAATSEMYTDISKKDLLECSLKMLRYMLESHIEGSYHCVEGEKWGHTWISILGIERAMHAIDIMIPYINENDRALLKKVLISEADWMLNEYTIVASKYAKGNKPESNMWNGVFLHRISSMYPDCQNAEQYKKKGNIFLVNAISVDSDALSEVIYDGERVKDLYINSNFFDSYSLDHHGYLNVGYMVITLSNLAMYHFACKINHFSVPEALYHHSEELWKVIKTFMFHDGRLIRIGGDTRVRYCYCQDYAIPMLLFIADYFCDPDAIEMLSGIVDLYDTEMDNNGDGSFLSDRCAGFKKLSPIYYTRLESDRAAMLSMILCWEKFIGKVADNHIAFYESWNENYHGAYVVRGKNRFASSVMSGGTGPLTLCLPIDHSDLAEWDHNLTGLIKGASARTIPDKEGSTYAGYSFKGGFVNVGTIPMISEYFIAEQQKAEITAQLTTINVALPDDATMIVMQYAVSPQRIYVMESMGLNLNIPNDVFNHKYRRYYFDGEYHDMKAIPGADECYTIKDQYINIDDILGVYGGYGKNYTLFRTADRSVGIKVNPNQDKLHESYTNSFYCDRILKNIKTQPAWYDKGSVIFDEGAILRAGVNGYETKQLAELQTELELKITIHASDMTRSIITKGADQELYLVVANLSNEPSPLQIENGNFVDFTNNNRYPDTLLPKQVIVLKEKKKV